MFCMKCGREVEEGQVFCLDCRLEMEKYPVRPGTVVLLPKRTENSFVKKAPAKRRSGPTPEEQIRSLKQRLRTLTFLWMITLVLLAALLYPTVRELVEGQQLRPGQNYSSITESTNTP